MSDFLKNWQRERGRVIIFAGVFDPVHKGHMSVAERALKTNGGLVVFLPERVPTHKHGRTNFEDRVNMLKLAIQDNPHFRLLESPFDHHTIKETLSWIKNQFSDGQNLGLLFGADVASHFESWADVDTLPNFGFDRVIFADRVTDSIFDIHSIKIEGVRIETMRADNAHLTSTLIRQDPKNRASALPVGVLDYIKKNKLYDSASSAGSK